MSRFIGVPAKATSDINLVDPLSALLTDQAGKDIRDRLESLNKLRKAIVTAQVASCNGLEAVQSYSDQLNSFISKCSLDEVPIDFSWKDAFDRSILGLFGTTQPLILQSLKFERVCVLFNVAASYSSVAASTLNEDIHNEYALQMAAKYFQISSGIFLNLKQEVPLVLGQESTQTDANTSILDILHYLMLAQAQETIFVKAAQNQMADATLSRLAAQCADYYAQCYKLVQINKDLWPEKDWYRMMKAKHLAFGAISDFCQSVTLAATKKYGEEIAWLHHASENFQKAESKSTLSEYLLGYQRRTTRRLEEARRENDFIYHARIPDYTQLEPIERLPLVRPTPLSVKFLPDTVGLFDSLTLQRREQTFQQLEPKREGIESSS